MMDDQTLVSRVASGDAKAFRELIERHQRLVAHMIGRLVLVEEDREELCQDVFLRVYDKIGEFNFQSKLSTWIATIAYRYSINYLRKKKMSFSTIPDEESFSTHFIAESNPQQALSEQDEEEVVRKMIEKLPAQYRTIVTLYHLDQMSYAEIGEVTGMPEGTVKNYLFRARKLLKDKLDTYLGPNES